MIGSNVSTIGGLTNGFIRGDLWDCECIQIYISPSRRWVIPPLTDNEIVEFENAWKASRIKQVIAHVPFLVNLASSNRDIQVKSLNRLKTEISRAHSYKVNYLVLHPGSSRNSTRKKGIEHLITSLNHICEEIDNYSTLILLETMAGQGNVIGSTFEELAIVLDNMSSPELFGVCFDTAHVFLAGYDIRGYEGYEKVLSKFDEIVGLNKIKAFHLNNTDWEIGSKVDRHSNLGGEKLGSQVFHAILRDPRFQNVPKIIEIPSRDEDSIKNLNYLRHLRSIENNIFEPKKGQMTLESVF